jgi:hypothetical protein
LSWDTFDGKGRELEASRWRVVQGTGNCCENYVAATDEGRLYDFGGTHLKFTDDLGETWKIVRPDGPMVNGEGTLTAAPGGDFVGLTWDPYSGDHIVAFKYDAAAEQWYYMHQRLYHPFFDRPWMTVVRGPFTVGAVTVPYITILESNFMNEFWYYSLDGINYTHVSSETVDGAPTAAVESWLPDAADPEADYFQPHAEFDVSPLNGGGAVSADTGLISLGERPDRILVPPDLRWQPYAFKGEKFPSGRLIQDSRGYLHVMSIQREDKDFTYWMSRDGGRTWDKKVFGLPPEHIVEDVDFKAHGKLGISALAVHAHDKRDDFDQDLLFEFAYGGRGAPKLKRLYFVGDGDENIGAGLGSNLRFDFATVAILPDGTLAMSFIDKSRGDPAIAILLR